MKIAVAMTTYNGASFLAEQLDSIFAQSRLPDELIVCDDRSTDSTQKILDEYAARAPFPMTVILNEERLGSTKNFERAVDHCSGDLIALCDQDDIWRQDKLTRFEAAFEADPQLGAVVTNAALIDSNGRRLHGDLWSRCLLNQDRQDRLNGSAPYDLLLAMPVATGATMAFRSRFKPLVLPIPTASRTMIHDRWIALVIAGVGRLQFIADELISYRLHKQQQIGVGKLPLPLKAFIPDQCRSDAAGLAALHDRLEGNTAFPPDPAFLAALEDRQRHVCERTKFSRNPLRRLWQVASECLSGRYFRYPFGLIFPFRDLLVGTR